MFTTYDTDNQIIAQLEINDYYSLCCVNTQCNTFICKNTEYQIFQQFNIKNKKHYLKYLQMNESIRKSFTNDKILQLQRFELAIKCNHHKLISKYYMSNIPYYYYNRIWSAIIKTDDPILMTELLPKYSTAYHHPSHHEKAKLRRYINEHKSIKIKNECILSIPYSLGLFIYDVYAAIKYIYISKLYLITDVGILTKIFDRFFQRHFLKWFPNCNEIYYFDAISKIILETDIKYDLYNKLLIIRNELVEPRNKNKMKKYLNLHFPAKLKSRT